jgi:predicted RNase H-like nuclease
MHWGKWSMNAPAEVQILQGQQKMRNLKSAGTPGWRVRVFRENSKSARQKSLELVQQLRIICPDIPVYWNYESPYFKVSVGDFRTKEEAIRFLQKNKEQIPSAFVVSEAILPAVPSEIPTLDGSGNPNGLDTKPLLP